jgi:hypothetical protein
VFVAGAQVTLDEAVVVAEENKRLDDFGSWLEDQEDD